MIEVFSIGISNTTAEGGAEKRSSQSIGPLSLVIEFFKLQTFRFAVPP